MGSERTSLQELLEHGRALLGSYLRGVYAMGDQPPHDGSTHAIIVNTTRAPGEHWLCIARTPTEELLYDSYGRQPGATFVPQLEGLETSEPDPEQPLDAAVQWCGQACLAFALVARDHGLDTARRI